MRRKYLCVKGYEIEFTKYYHERYTRSRSDEPHQMPFRPEDTRVFSSETVIRKLFCACDGCSQDQLKQQS